ncbi:hypothetical protein PLICRDRAFT_51427 [Plicaturopsis crispa FD-325 SS-3]|nr:hypothetical protein PLICRDRAFT_51427 [Plicaturopsis crispa FD-325 SS-3]
MGDNSNQHANPLSSNQARKTVPKTAKKGSRNPSWIVPQRAQPAEAHANPVATDARDDPSGITLQRKTASIPTRINTNLHARERQQYAMPARGDGPSRSINYSGSQVNLDSQPPGRFDFSSAPGARHPRDFVNTDRLNHAALNSPRPVVAKSSAIPPFFHLEDSARKSISSRKRPIDTPGGRTASRMTAASTSTSRRGGDYHKSAGDKLPVAVIGPNMTLIVDGVPVSTLETNVNAIGGRNIHMAGVKAARKTAFTQTGRKSGKRSARTTTGKDLFSEDDDDESSSSSRSESESSSGSSNDVPSSRASSSSSSDEDERQPRETTDDARVSEEPVQLRRNLPAEPDETLLAALKAVVTAPQRGRIPFLRRNLRRGFLHRCQLTGISSPKQPVPPRRQSVIYRLDDEHQYEAHMNAPECPLCMLHGAPFPSEWHLWAHIAWDHGEVSVIEAGDNTIVVEVPPLGTINTDREESPLRAASAAPPVRNVTPPQIIAESAPLFPANQIISSPHIAPSIPPSHPIVDGPLTQPVELPIPAKKYRSPSPPVPLVAPRAYRPTTTFRHDPRYPTPPPPDDPNGPAARPPYLPARYQDGDIRRVPYPEDPQNADRDVLYFSCRPGGARLVDLVSTLPLEPFGVLAWSVVDKEEEIFEVDDVRDEDKVMQALWARWIMLNRNLFVSNYYRGTLAFVDEYWRIIHRAAGWGALRVWLLMLVVNRFLQGPEIVDILKHYESLTGRATWYTL